MVRKKRKNWRVKMMETQGSLVERVMAGEVEGGTPGEDPGSGGEISFN